jgi:hypothetical protein
MCIYRKKVKIYEQLVFVKGAIVYLLVIFHGTGISKEDLAFLLLAGSKCHTKKKG